MALPYGGMEAGVVGAQSELLGYSGFISSTGGTNPPLTREQLDHAARCIQPGPCPGLASYPLFTNSLSDRLMIIPLL